MCILIKIITIRRIRITITITITISIILVLKIYDLIMFLLKVAMLTTTLVSTDVNIKITRINTLVF